MMPETLYAAGKASADLMVMSYFNNFKLDLAIVRPFNNYGPRQNEKLYAAVIPITVKKILAGEPPVICGDGRQTRDFIYVGDTVSGMIDIYKNKDTRGKVLNIATGRELKIKDLILTIAKEMNYEGKILKKAARQADVRRHLADIRLAKKLIGFKAKTNFKEGIRKTIEWYEKNSTNSAKN